MKRGRRCIRPHISPPTSGDRNRTGKKRRETIYAALYVISGGPVASVSDIWRNNKLQSIDQIMMLSAIANSAPSIAKKNFGNSVEQMANEYATDSHRKRRVYNTYRAIAIVKYLQSIKY